METNFLKQCSRCCEWKARTEFRRASKRKDGLQCECKDCANERSRRYSEENHDKILAAQRKYRKNNKKKISEYSRNYRIKNKEKLSERARQHRLNNLEDCRAKERSRYAEKREQFRERQLNNLYGITAQEYSFLLQQQDNKCACCGADQDESHSFNVDHDHETGDVRGLLCRRCNMGIGLLGDDINGVTAAVLYLQGAVVQTQKLLIDFRKKNEAILFARDRQSMHDPEGLCD